MECNIMPQENLLVHEQFNKAAEKYPDKASMRIKKNDGTWKSYTFKEVQGLAKGIGAFLVKEKFKKGDFALLISENRPEWGMVYLGMMYAGLVCVPLDPQLSSQEIDNIQNDCGARLVFVSAKTAEKISPKTRKESKIVILEPDFSRIASTSMQGISWPKVSTDDMASLIYTSGTTGKPKGVMLSHLNFCSNADSIDKMGIFLYSDNVLSILPLFHTYAFTVTLLIELFIGPTIVYLETVDSEALVHIMKEANITLLVGVPQLFNLIHKAVFDKLKKIPPFVQLLLTPLIKAKVRKTFGKGLRIAASGGAKLNAKVAQDLYRLGFHLIEGYGITEASPAVSFNPLNKVKFGSVGPPLANIAVRIDNPDKDGMGEILVKGPNIMLGYYKNPEQTQAVIKDGWFYTGDLGYLDREGYIYITGRAKDVIVLSSGKNIYPDELEEMYKSPYIKEICIVAKNEEKFGSFQESLFAVVVPNFDYFRQKEEINIQYRIRWELENCMRNLPSHQHVTGFVVSKEPFERTRLGKLKRHIIQEQYLKEAAPAGEGKEAAFSEEDLKGVDPEIARKIIDYLCAESKKKARLDSHIEIDLGIDSLMRVQLEAGLQALFKVKVPPAFMAKVYTVKELVIKVQELLGSGSAEAAGEEEKKSWGQILKEMPSKEILDKVQLSFNFWEVLFSLLVKAVLVVLFKVFWFLRGEGKENLPKDGPYILCPNHASYLDGFAIALNLPVKTALSTFFLGHTEIFAHPMVRWGARIGRLVPVDPTIHLTEALQISSYVLKKGKIVCVFAEGGRSAGEKIAEFKKGIGILAKELEVPIVPVYVAGSYYSWPRGALLPRPYPLKVIFGRPVYGRQLGSDIDTITEKLREEVIKLIPKK